MLKSAESMGSPENASGKIECKIMAKLRHRSRSKPLRDYLN
jgi:DNA-directed RNA polymerase sigma subunit (sigma70/sigma32)